MSLDIELRIDATTLLGDNTRITIRALPDSCPSCRKGIEPKVLGGRQILSTSIGLPNQRYICFFQCPVKSCTSVFLASYEESTHSRGKFQLQRHGVLLYVSTESFPDSVIRISPKFVEIYRQARVAEENGLDEIAGCGFRRSLEFLIKDYLLSECIGDQKLEEETKKRLLADCIKQIDDARIRTVAKKATWLGNDETHYVRKFEQFDIQNLKELIKLTAYWVDAKETARRYDDELPTH